LRQYKAGSAGRNTKQVLIKVNQTQEKTYAQVLADEQAKAADIKANFSNLLEEAWLLISERR